LGGNGTGYGCSWRGEGARTTERRRATLPTYSAEGITLIAHAFRGTGRMVSFYTRERGLVEAVAQGIGKPGSSLAPAVELFTHSTLFLAEARGADRLSQARVIEPFYALRRDMTRYGYAAVACELIVRTTEPGQSIPGLFEMLVGYLHAMESTADPRVLSWAFELAYLELSGIGPVIDRCPACSAESLGGVYVAAHGGTLCAECAPREAGGCVVSPGTARTIAAMRRFDVGAMERLRLADATRGQVRRLIGDHIRYHLDLNLKSEQFVNGLSQWEPPPRRSRPRGEVESGGGEDDE
jgi:DNA repair protein RecO (recombination protein O)